jgi:site-specific DNA-methyltransferase (adenine-specific)
LVNIEKIGNNTKEYFSYKNAALFNGNILDDKLFIQEFADLIVTSPPYNVGIDYNSNDDELSYEEYLRFSEQWMKNCYKWSKIQARFCLNIPLDKNKGGHKSVGADLTKIAQSVGWQYKTTIIWNEGNISRRTAWGSWKSASAPVIITPVELIVVFYKGEWKKTNGSKISDITADEFKEWTQGVWVFNGESKKRIGHPAPFPKELPNRCIKMFSYVDDMIFDPFSGSGTTLLSAQSLNRKSIGVEIDDKYCELAKNRFLKENGVLNFEAEQ